MFTEGWADDLTGPFGVGFAFAAGVVSFLSPCVLPLVPAYVAHLTGVTTAPETPNGRRETLSHAFAFVSGFGLVFTAIGASAGLVGGLVNDEMPTLEKIAGVFLIVLGLNLMGVIKIPWLYRTYQFGPTTPAGETLAFAAGPSGGRVQSTPLSYARSAGFGAAFAIAWTPCIGPVLGAILTLAAASSTVYQGAYLLLAYSAGLAVPFMIAAFAVGSVTGTLRRFHRFLPALEVSMGAVVLLVGVLIFLNEFTSLNQYFNFLPELNSV
ncbi:MAG TPA: cytochrome c biogenesis CcdA family protein [Dehalococcoidia bacterium]|nr:cytochrome c biogenesis CcdA family protein [Dehalococcoidia bacterium]